MAEQALALSAFRLSQLPQDVQLSILLAFGIRELIICKRMCRALAQLIDGDVSVRYKIELARAGRIDGPSSLAVRIVDRLASLHAQQTMFRAGDHPLARLRGTRFGSWDALPSSGFVTTVSDGVVHLWRPAAASGLGELKISYSLEELGSTGVEKSSCVGDVAQDLLVFSGKNLNTLSFDCWIYSLAKGGPHPAASESRISSRIASDDWPRLRAWDNLQIFGDLIAWNVSDTGTRQYYEMRVINWKTGVTVWEFQSRLRLVRCHLISQSYVVVVTAAVLCIYPVDRHLENLRTPSTCASITSLCILELPAWPSSRFSHQPRLNSFIQFPSPLGPNDRPLHRPDPSLTLLTLHINYTFDVSENKHEKAQCAVFIPISTITAHVERSLRSPPRAPATSTGNGAPHTRVVPWSDWGPAGTHIAHFDRDGGTCHFSPMGSACAVSQRSTDASGNEVLKVLVFGVHPWARPDPRPQRADSEGYGDRFLQLAEADTRSGSGLGFTASIRTTFPFDVARRDIPLAREDRCPRVVLTEDGLLLVTLLVPP